MLNLVDTCEKPYLKPQIKILSTHYPVFITVIGIRNWCGCRLTSC